MRTSWHVETRTHDNQPWRPVADSGPRLSTALHIWADALAGGVPARLMLNNKPVRMRTDDEQLDLHLEGEPCTHPGLFAHAEHAGGCAWCTMRCPRCGADVPVRDL